jgi:NTE family protein
MWRYNNRYIFLFFLLIFFTTVNLSAQRVGLVLSGGGAKGLAHIGVLKALEENNVPVDYLTGTSMGGVVAGCYAAGLSPSQIEAVVLSNNFQLWINGKLEKGHNFFYSMDEPNPSFIRILLSLDSTLNLDLKSSLANDLSLNFALAETFSVPSAIANNNFDSLFVPLRVVASDIFTQNEEVLKDGRLSDALRATHTVPFFYEPIKINGKYLFDGGVYNNFPVDVMQRDFNPEVIIGVNVSSKVYDEYPFEEAEKLISKSLIYMLLDKSDPARIPESGVYIQPDLKGYSGIDFAKVRSLIDSGYAQAMRQMSEIKRKISATRTPTQVQQNRSEFFAAKTEFVINDVKFEGFNSKQRKYLSRFFSLKKGPIPITKIKSGYYNLVADEYFKNVYPSFSKDPDEKYFKFQITRRPQKNFQVDFGGVISNRNFSSLFLGANYYNFNRALTHTTVNIYAGNFLKSAQLKTRIDVPLMGRFYLEPRATFNDWDFLANRDLLTGKKNPTILRRFDRSIGLNVGFPASREFRFSLYGNYILNSDRYSNKNVLISTDTLDILRLHGWQTGLLLETNNLNRKQYPTRGKNISLKFDWINLTENYEPGNTSIIPARSNHSGWVRLKFSAEQYWKTGVYSSGYLVEGVLSNQPTFSNYYGTIINAPAFLPLQDSRSLLLQKFRAFNYAAGGLRNIFSLKPNLDLRLEGYVFKPFESILPTDNQEARLSGDITKVSFAAMAALVLHSSIGPISFSFNYYDDKEYQFGGLIHVGYLLFQKTSLE